MESIVLIKLITFLYVLFNSGRVFSYIPQIIAVFKERNPVLAISLITWSFWTAANFTTALYATIVLPDALLAFMSYGNSLGCAIVVVLVIYKRYKYDYWPKSKRIKVFDTKPVNMFTEVPNIESEEIYHFFDVKDDTDENHTVTFNKAFTHEPIDSFESFIKMAKTTEAQIIPETNESQIIPETNESHIIPETNESHIIPETNESHIIPETTESHITPEKIVITSSPKKKTRAPRKKKQT